jgi:hypothetical protein
VEPDLSKSANGRFALSAAPNEVGGLLPTGSRGTACMGVIPRRGDGLNPGRPTAGARAADFHMVRGGGCDGPDALTVVKGATRLVAE